MQKIIITFIITLLCFSAMAEDRKVAVFDPAGNANNTVKEIVREIISSVIVNTDGYAVLERQLINKVLEEQRIQVGGLVDDNQIVQMGKLMGAKYAFVSSVTIMLGNNYFVSIKMIDVQTGRIEKQNTEQTKRGMDDLIDVVKVQTSEIVGKKIEPPPSSNKIAIAIGSFSGYKNNEAETSIRNAFVQDGRFVVRNAQNTSRFGSNQQSFTDVDYIVNGTCSLVQRAQTTYINVPATRWTAAKRIPQTIPETVNVDLTLTNVRGEIIVSTTYKLNNLNRISGDIFPVILTVKRVSGKDIQIVRIGDGNGTIFNGDTYNVYEVYSNDSKSKIGALKIGKSLDKCRITEGEKVIAQKFNSGANLVVER